MNISPSLDLLDRRVPEECEYIKISLEHIKLDILSILDIADVAKKL